MPYSSYIHLLYTTYIHFFVSKENPEQYHCVNGDMKKFFALTLFMLQQSNSKKFKNL